MNLKVALLLGAVATAHLSAQSDSFVHTTDSSSIMGGTSEIGVSQNSFITSQIFLYQHRFNIPGTPSGARYRKVIGQSIRTVSSGGSPFFIFIDHYGVGNQDETAMPAGLHFNALKTDASDTDAFIHTADAASAFFNSTTLDHPSLNGNPGAIAFINPQYKSGLPTYPEPIGLWNIGASWAIYPEDNSSTIPTDSRYTVVVPDPAKFVTFVHTTTAANTAGLGGTS